jgi:hypothetical protein
MKQLYDDAYNSSTTMKRDGTTRRSTMQAIHKSGEPIVVLKRLLQDTDIIQINTLANCVSKAEMMNNKSVRHFSGDNSSYGGGNQVIHLSGYMQYILPSIMSKIMLGLNTAVATAEWYPYPQQLGIRCIEVLTYQSESDTKELLLHIDSESIFTIAIMLTNPEVDFKGGDFIISRHKDPSSTTLVHDDVDYDPSDSLHHHYVKTNNSKNLSSILPQDVVRHAAEGQCPGDAVLFDSNSLHGVERLLSGTRRVLVLELWPYADAVLGQNRPAASAFSGMMKLPSFLVRSKEDI